MSERRVLGGRPDKAALGRMKVTTVVVTIAAFVGSLGLISYLHPAVGANSGAANQALASVNQFATNGSTGRFNRRSLQLAGSAQSNTLAPLTRTRGS